MANKFQLTQRDRVGKSLQDAQKNKLMFYKGKDGKKKAHVTKEELEAFKKRKNDASLTLRDYLNEMQGKTRRKDSKKTTTTVTKTPEKNKKAPPVAKTKDKDKSKVTSNMSVNRPGQAKSKSATQINRELREQIKSSPKVVGQKKNKTDKVIATNIAGAGAGKDASKKKSKSLFKRLTGVGTKPEKDKDGILSNRFKRKSSNNKSTKTTSSYNKKADPSAISYRKGGGNAFVARQYGGKIGN